MSLRSLATDNRTYSSPLRRLTPSHPLTFALSHPRLLLSLDHQEVPILVGPFLLQALRDQLSERTDRELLELLRITRHVDVEIAELPEELRSACSSVCLREGRALAVLVMVIGMIVQRFLDRTENLHSVSQTEQP